MGYFSDSATRPGTGGRYATLADLPQVEASPGVLLRALAGSRLMLSHVTVAPGAVAAVHTHDEEQLGLILSGGCEFELAGERRTLHPGDIYLAPAGVAHGLVGGPSGCVLVDLFAPPRRALLDLLP